MKNELKLERVQYDKRRILELIMKEKATDSVLFGSEVHFSMTVFRVTRVMTIIAFCSSH